MHRITDELLRVHKLLHVVLVEARDELEVDFREIELFQGVLEVSNRELLATSLEIGRIRFESAFKV